VKLSIMDAGLSCSKCAQPLRYLTFDRTDEDLLPVTVTSCSKCGRVSLQSEIAKDQSANMYAAGQSARRLIPAIEKEKEKEGDPDQVPSFVYDWCARRDETGHWQMDISV